ncbi:MAG: type II toxin-antitoxin system HicA family toxin [Patescibacteria group bacterium]
MSDRLPQITSRELIRILERRGFMIRRITGGHIILRHGQTKRMATVPSHPGDLQRGLVFGILKQAGIDLDDFKKDL